MPNRRFETLLIEHIDEFVTAFSNTAKHLFRGKNNRGIHPGEFGMYREKICANFLKFLMPSNFEIGSGFLINESGGISTQIDLIIYEPSITPLIKSKEMIRFFPVESTVGIGEVKSDLDKRGLKDALNKLGRNKRLRDELLSPVLVKSRKEKYEPEKNASDLIFSFLICNKLTFYNNDLAKTLNEIYDESLEYRFRHNLVLSIKDGLLCYFHVMDSDDVAKVTVADKSKRFKEGTKFELNIPFNKDNIYLNRFIKPVENKYVHLKKFATYFSMGISRTTYLRPEMSNYMEKTPGGRNFDEDLIF